MQISYKYVLQIGFLNYPRNTLGAHLQFVLSLGGGVPIQEGEGYEFFHGPIH